MRVLVLSWEYPPNVVGGMGRHVAELTPALVRAGLEVHLITPQVVAPLSDRDAPIDVGNSGLDVTHDGVVVHRVPCSCSSGSVYQRARESNQAMLDKGRALIEDNHSFDLIHAHDWLVVFAGYELKQEYRLPLVATIHATERGRARGGTLHTDLQRSIHGAEWWLVYEAWRVITCSQHMASETQAFFNLPAEKIDVVPNGVSPYRGLRWSPADLAACRARYGALDGPVIFTVGRLVHEKGFHLLVEAAPRILSEFPKAQFIVAGRGPEALHLQQQARGLGVADHICFPGFISDEQRDCLYHVADCTVFPSLYEPFGIVALEAMAAGCPVVVTGVGGLREVVRHGKNGVTIYPNDVDSLAWGVLHTLRNPTLAATRAEEARQAVYREFNWDTIAEQTIAIYHRVVDERQRVDWTP